jgi:hypothetical protein
MSIFDGIWPNFRGIYVGCTHRGPTDCRNSRVSKFAYRRVLLRRVHRNIQSAANLRRAISHRNCPVKGARVFLAVIRPVESDPVPPVVASIAALSSVPTSVVQPDQPAGPPGSEVPWVSDLLSEFSEVFQDPLPAGLPPERSEGHSILTKPGHPPPFRSMYRLSPLEYRELEKQVTNFLKDGILEVSQSPYGAPVLFVPKPNGRGLRLCVDYRALNSITVKNRCTIPRIDDLLDAVAVKSILHVIGLDIGLSSDIDF